ncbi:MAG: alpha amylase C-terminal domain-containing protein [Bacteroidia bacterium]|nr:alpha amylase C-terminal domain-containing protein [Bacteroidia bacterium]
MSDALTPLALIEDDSWLEPYEPEIRARLQRCLDTRAAIEAAHGSLRAFASAHHHLGFSYDPDQRGWWYREWAPAAEALYLIGDFNGWERRSHPLHMREDGVWEVFVPDADTPLTHESKVKVHVLTRDGARDRIPAYIRRTVQDPQSHDFAGQIWHPETPFVWTDETYQPDPDAALYIYECHPGMAQEKHGVGTWREFADNVLPRVKDLGYNVIQMMAVQEHPYYGSFGYHVSSLFAPSSRFGTPEDLKYLINAAHGMGIAVIMDIVHSHAVKNIAEGLAFFDGSDDQYFHPGGRGYHTGWDSYLYNYGKREVQQFLLSNVAYWLEEFHFDGYRFDGVTSMMYIHHGDMVSFETYDQYFKEGDEWDAITYLQLANLLAHEVRTPCITIAEDMSGMPGCCRPVLEGGLGFDYRLGMGIPDYWIKMLKHKPDEAWDIFDMWYTLTNRRWKEKTVAYTESHDQALVGDKTLAFWLMDKEMYWNMQVGTQNLAIDRGIALHKMLRLLTAGLGGEAYLNFMGNEFGHPEWIDFPREGNGWSYQYARRQWSLVDNQDLKYRFMNDFDRAMLQLMQAHQVLEDPEIEQLNMDMENQAIIFSRGGLVFVFNFSPTSSVPDYEFYVPEPGTYRIILSSDDPAYGGFGRIDTSLAYFTQDDEMDSSFLSIYLTNRTALVLQREEA